MNLPVMTRSGLEAARCGLRYKTLYVDGLDDPSDYSLRGTAIHLCRRKYVERLAAAQIPQDAEEARLAFIEGVRDAKTPPQLIPEVRDVFERHVEHFELNLEAFIATERRRVNATAALPHQFEPDLEYAWPDALEIQDIKTYYVAMTEAQARTAFQTRFYMWAAMQAWPNFPAYRFTYDFIRLNKFVSVQFSPDEFDMLDREVRAWDAVRQARHAEQRWDAEPGEVCTFCHLHCPVRDDPRRAYLRVTNEQEARGNAGQIIVLEKELKMRKQIERAWCAAHGGLTVDGEHFGFKVSTTRTYAGQAVVDTVRQLGEEPSFRVSASALKPMFKRLRGLEQDLEPVLETKETAKFTHWSEKGALRAIEGAAPDDEE